jgi:RNA polymerase sigma-70 factor (ECF subfamily)
MNDDDDHHERATDRELAQRVTRLGDEAAFRTLYRRHTPPVYALVVRMLGDASAEADDVLQDAWMRAVRALPRFRWESTLRTWITGIAVNRVREVFRSRTRRRDDGSLDDRPTPAGPVLDSGMRLDLEGALNALPEGYRTVLLLHDWEGYTHPEISQRLEIAVGTSRSQLFHARRALRRLLGEEEGAPV